jgi:hypothetical protein
MRRFSILILLAAVVAPTALGARPLAGKTLLAIDGKALFRNFLPTTMLSGFTYTSWSYRDRVLRVEFQNKAGVLLEWDVTPMPSTTACGKGSQQRFQLNGNKVWWSQRPEVQLSWRCVFGQDGIPLLLVASSPAATSKVAPAGLGIVVASAKRY